MAELTRNERKVEQAKNKLDTKATKIRDAGGDIAEMVFNAAIAREFEPVHVPRILIAAAIAVMARNRAAGELLDHDKWASRLVDSFVASLHANGFAIDQPLPEMAGQKIGVSKIEAPELEETEVKGNG